MECINLVKVTNLSNVSLSFDSLPSSVQIIEDKDGNVLRKESKISYVQTEDGFLFENNDGEYTLIKYVGNNHTVTLPESINGSGYDIHHFTGAINIIIPFGFANIPDSAFYGCTSLKSITIPNTVTSIGESAFYGCTSLKSITIPDTVTSIGRYAFEGCTSLESVELPKELTRIERYMFENCTSLESITIPNGVSVIGSAAFYNCESLKSITIPKEVTSIEAYAFKGCISLDSISIPDSVTHIGWIAFDDTAYYNNPDNWKDGALYIGDHLVSIDKNAETVVIVDGTKTIIDAAFDECYLIKTITLGGDYSNNYLLSGLTNLETLIITTLPTYNISGYLHTAPITLKTVVLKADCDVRNKNLFRYINGVTIIVEAEKEACLWDYDYSGWNNGNKVLYGGDWYCVNYYDADGELITTHYYSASEIIKPPYVPSYSDKTISYEFNGWDMDGDGVVDSLPAIINRNYDFRAIVTEKEASYTINYMDKDGKTVLYTYKLPYGANVPVPANPAHKGYDFLGWTNIPTIVTENVNVYSEWVHEEGTHEYTSRLVAPTCTENGYTLHTCLICGENYKLDITDALGHSYGEWMIIEAATCVDDGLMRRQCSCGDIQDAIVDCEGHNYVIANKIESTCQNEGTVKYVCSVCEVELTESIPLAAHKYEKTYASKSWLKWLIENLMDIFFGYENGQAYYYKCAYCNHIATVDESISNDSAGTMSSCDHVLSDWTTGKVASCDDGYDVKYCIICDEAVEARITNATGQHIYDSEPIVVQPTCTEDGYTVHTCHCGDSYMDSYVDALGHDCGDWYETEAPTCTATGTDERECSVCHTKETRTTDALGHIDAIPVVENKVDSTCTTDGSYDGVIYCSICGDELSREAQTINKLGHDYSIEWTIDTAPTCITVGSKSYHCSRCDDKADVTEVPANGHVYGDWYETEAPTCTATGTEERECTVCYTKETRTTDALGHAGAIPVAENSVDATCTTDGSYDSVIYCSICGIELSRGEKVIDKLGHDYSTEWTIDSIPTCTTVGSMSHHCTRCNAKTSAIEIPANGHSFANWKQTKAPTCTEAGIERRVCVNCDHFEERQINALGHNDISVVTSPTCTEQGYTTHRCSRCNEGNYVDSYVDALGHSFTNYVSNNDATYTEDGTKTSKCDRCDETDTIVDVGSAFGMAQKFRDEMVELNTNGNAETTYMELYAVLQTYSTLSGKEKAEVAKEFATLQQMINAYNAKAETANNELTEATELAFAPIAVTSFAFLAALWFVLRKKFLV